MLDSAGGSTYTFARFNYSNTRVQLLLNARSNSVRLGFLFQPIGSAPGVTAVQYQLFLDGKSVGTQAATTVPDDIALWLLSFVESKGTIANDLAMLITSKRFNKDNKIILSSFGSLEELKD